MAISIWKTLFSASSESEYQTQTRLRSVSSAIAPSHLFQRHSMRMDIDKNVNNWYFFCFFGIIWKGSLSFERNLCLCPPLHSCASSVCHLTPSHSLYVSTFEIKWNRTIWMPLCWIPAGHIKLFALSSYQCDANRPWQWRFLWFILWRFMKLLCDTNSIKNGHK